MEYKDKKLGNVLSITNVELSLLQIIGEKKQISGYDINKIIIERGFRNWANIGMTSIYKGLEKLEKKGLVLSSLSKDKVGKGPVPRLFKLTEKGFKILKETIFESLSRTSERDHRFDLGLAGIGFLNSNDVIEALSERIEFLQVKQNIIKSKLNNDMKFRLPYAAILVFEHPISIIANELRFVESIITQLKKEI